MEPPIRSLQYILILHPGDEWQPRVVSLQTQLFTLLLRGFVYDKYLAMFNKQFNKHFCCAIWLVRIRCRHIMSRLNPHSPTFGSIRLLFGADPGRISSFTKLLTSCQNLLAFCVLRQGKLYKCVDHITTTRYFCISASAFIFTINQPASS
jgi:hypothetical protein